MNTGSWLKQTKRWCKASCEGFWVTGRESSNSEEGPASFIHLFIHYSFSPVIYSCNLWTDWALDLGKAFCCTTPSVHILHSMSMMASLTSQCLLMEAWLTIPLFLLLSLILCKQPSACAKCCSECFSWISLSCPPQFSEGNTIIPQFVDEGTEAQRINQDSSPGHRTCLKQSWEKCTTSLPWNHRSYQWEWWIFEPVSSWPA